jgi:WD40 repeat protein
MGKKLLIAAGTARYDHLPTDLQRPQLTQVVEDVAQLFTGKLGYERVLTEISRDPTSDNFRKKLDKWFASTEREKSDWLVFYYTGHGELEGDSFFLLTKDSEGGSVVSTAVSAETLGQILVGKGAKGEKRRIKNCLLILDTCYSGSATFDIFAKLRHFFDEGDQGLFFVISATLPRKETFAGALAKAIIESIQDEALGGPRQRLLNFDDLRVAVNRRLKVYPALFSTIGSSADEAEFLPNPRYVAHLPSGATVAEIRRAVESGEMLGFWGPTSRGVELDIQPGWYFTGRERILTELSEWLRNPKDERTRVITGRPGSGKSAILSRIVTLSDSSSRQRIPNEGMRWLEAFPVECISLAIYAKGKTLEEVIVRLARQTGVKPERAAVLEALTSRQQPFNIVFDALDEASEPELIARELLTPLHSMPMIKLLVGTRAEYADKLGKDSVRLFIDQEKYFEKADLAKYVESRLLCAGEKSAETPYTHKKDLAAKIGAAVADKAFPNFLIARLVIEDLLSLPDALDQASIAGRNFPGTVSQAFAQYLKRFGAQEEKVRDLLSPLAWAEGVGLPWGNIWPLVASRLADRSYKDDDIRWVMERAGSFVREDLEQDRSVYRLYHQALADYLRQGRTKEEVQRTIVQTLMDTVPRLVSGRGVDRLNKKDWRLAHPYIRIHLAEHAAACGMLADLVEDPLYLLTADSDRLLVAIEASGLEVPERIAHVYKGVFHQLQRNIVESVSYLEMIARKSGADELADRAARLPLRSPWSVTWVRWQTLSTHRIFAEQPSPVTTLMVAQRQREGVVISGGEDGSIRIWDLYRGTSLGLPLSGHTDSVTALAVAQRQGESVVVSGSHDGSIRIWNLEQSTMLGPPLVGHRRSVTALAVARRKGKVVIVSGGSADGVRLWDLDQSEPLGSPLVGGKVGIGALAVAHGQSSDVVISGGYDGSIRIWDLGRGDTVRPPLMAHEDSATLLAVAQRQGKTVILSASVCEQHIHIWDLESGEAVGRLTSQRGPATALMVIRQSGRSLVVIGTTGRNICIWDLESGEPFGPPLVGHTSTVRDLAVAQSEGRTVILSAGAEENTIRIWDLEKAKASSQLRANHSDFVEALAFVQRQGRTIILSGGADNNICIWDAVGGQAVGLPLIGHTKRVGALTIAKDHGRTLVISGSDDNTIRIWDLERGEALGLPLTGHTDSVTALAISELRGRTVIISGSNDNSIRTWDLQKGETIGVAVNAHMDCVNALVVLPDRRGQPFVASGGDENHIRIWDLKARERWEIKLPGHREVRALAVAERQGRTVMVSGCAEDILILDMGNHNAVWLPHTDLVTAVAVGQQGKRSLIISGSDDCIIRIWDLDTLRLIQSIDLGASIASVAFLPNSTVVVGTAMGLIAIRLHIL